jgi:hypothetical protein
MIRTERQAQLSMTEGRVAGPDAAWAASRRAGLEAIPAVAVDVGEGQADIQALTAGRRAGLERGDPSSSARLRAALDELQVLVDRAPAGDVQALRPELAELHRRLIEVLDGLRSAP